MKQILKTRRRLALAFTAIVCLATVTSSFAGPTREKKKSSARIEVENAENVRWKITKDFSKASYINDQRRTEVFFDNKDNLIGTSVFIEMKELPAEAQRDIAVSYGTYTAAAAIKFKDAHNNVNYYVEMTKGNESMILQADPDGSVELIKTIKR